MSDFKSFTCLGCGLFTVSRFDLDGKEHIECPNSMGGIWKNELCVKCGKNERYERNGRVFELCASCAWENLQHLLFGEIKE
jgi:hypothetical protein